MITGLALGAVMITIVGWAMAVTWHRYGALALAAPQALAACPQSRELRFRIVRYGPVDGGKVVTLPVRPRSAPAPLHPPLRAAA